MISASIINFMNKDLMKLLNDELNHLLITEKEKLEKYSKDETPGNYKFYPDAVFLPEKEADILKIIELSKKYRFPVTPRGGGTSRCGGPLPVYGGVVLSLERMNKIIDFDEKNHFIVVEPGVITNSINFFLKEKGFFYPPDPSSLESSTIGGNVATNAGGPKCLKYGVTRNWVYGLDVMTTEGKISLGGKILKNATGYSLLNLMIGSEGTLGIFTKIILRYIRRKNFETILFIVFKDINEATEKTIEIIKNGIIPDAIEFIDSETAEVLKEHSKDIQIPEGSILIIIFSNDDKRIIERFYDRISNICESAKDILVAEDQSLKEKVLDFRRNIAEKLDKFGTIVPEDIVVPVSKIPETVNFVKNLSTEYMTKIFTFGHIGDGNIHIDIIEKENINTNKIIHSLFKAIKELGGKISGEHGIGLTKKEFLKYSRNELEVKFMKKIKSIFDPDNLLNPGKIF